MNQPNFIEQRIAESAKARVSFNGDKARHEHMTLVASVVAPVLQSVVGGFLFGFFWGSVALTVAILANLKEPLKIAGMVALVSASAGAMLAYAASLFFWWKMRIAYDHAAGINYSLSASRKAGARYYMPSPTPSRQLSVYNFPGVSDDQVKAFAVAMVKDRRTSTSENRWCVGPQRVFDKPQFALFREEFINRHLGEWLNPQHKSLGWKIREPAGWAFLEAVAGGRFVEEQPDPDADFHRKYGDDLQPYRR